MKILTLNVCGIRASQKKGLFKWLTKQSADIICLQEVRASHDQINTKEFELKGFERYMSEAEKKGYSGVCVYIREKPLSIKKTFGSKVFANEGRFIQVELQKVNIISVYFPSGSSGEKRQKMKYEFMDKFKKYILKIKKNDKPTIISGDWNIVHKEIDIKNWKSNQKNSGCLPKERAWLDDIFDNHGCIDTFRSVNKRAENYTWWSNRGKAWENNVGWRIDYQVMTPNDKIYVVSSSIYKKQRFSDHSPLIMSYEFK